MAPSYGIVDATGPKVSARREISPALRLNRWENKRKTSTLRAGLHSLTNEQTVDVLTCLVQARAIDPVRWGDDVDIAIGAAYFHRAPEVEDVESYEEIPGELGSTTTRILKGYSDNASMEEHCRSPVEVFGACALHLAVGWGEGKSGPRWAFESVREAWAMGPMDTPRQWRNLERAEREIL